MVEPNFEKGRGLLPVIVQDAETNRVLMLAYMNREAWQKTVETRKAHFWSRSRGKIWLKGETSGNVQELRDIYVDCDMDTILIKVYQHGGAACHEGYESCFYRRLGDSGDWVVEENRKFDPREVYQK